MGMKQSRSGSHSAGFMIYIVFRMDENSNQSQAEGEAGV